MSWIFLGAAPMLPYPLDFNWYRGGWHPPTCYSVADLGRCLGACHTHCVNDKVNTSQSEPAPMTPPVGRSVHRMGHIFSSGSRHYVNQHWSTVKPFQLLTFDFSFQSLFSQPDLPTLPTYLPTYLPYYLHTCLSTYLPTYLPTHLPTYHLPNANIQWWI
jgi:hypothetical protein